jgi:hypothetical protein
LVRAAAGDRFDGLEFNSYPSSWPIVVTDDLCGEARKLIARFRKRTGVELTEQEAIDSTHVFIGSIDHLVEKFSDLRERLGITSVRGRRPQRSRPAVERLVGS